MNATNTNVTYTRMTDAEYLQMIIKEVERINRLGYAPTTKNYTRYKRPELPPYASVNTRLKMPWKEIVDQCNILSTPNTYVRTSWQFANDQEVLEAALEQMSKLETISYMNYQNFYDMANYPSIQLTLNRLGLKWNDLVAKYVEVYGETENLHRKKKVSVPYSRYSELLRKEEAYMRLLAEQEARDAEIKERMAKLREAKAAKHHPPVVEPTPDQITHDRMAKARAAKAEKARLRKLAEEQAAKLAEANQAKPSKRRTKPSASFVTETKAEKETPKPKTRAKAKV